MCFLSWLYESLGIISAFLTPFLHNLGFHNLHYPDVILMFVVIPFLHLMNDEDTKTIIAHTNWYQGVRHTLGISTQITQVIPERVQEGEQNSNGRAQRLPSRNAECVPPG